MAISQFPNYFSHMALNSMHYINSNVKSRNLICISICNWVWNEMGGRMTHKCRRKMIYIIELYNHCPLWCGKAKTNMDEIERNITIFFCSIVAIIIGWLNNLAQFYTKRKYIIGSRWYHAHLGIAWYRWKHQTNYLVSQRQVWPFSEGDHNPGMEALSIQWMLCLCAIVCSGSTRSGISTLRGPALPELAGRSTAPSYSIAGF